MSAILLELSDNLKNRAKAISEGQPTSSKPKDTEGLSSCRYFKVLVFVGIFKRAKDLKKGLKPQNSVKQSASDVMVSFLAVTCLNFSTGQCM